MIRKSTYVLLIILLVLLALVIFLQRTPGLKSSTSNQPTSTPSSMLISWEGKTVDNITMADNKGHIFKSRLDNQKNWYIEQPSGCQLENGKISSALSQLQNSKIMVEMEAPPALADVGLSNPTYRITLNFSDGSLQTLSVGSIVPTGSGYYIQVDKNPVVVVTKISVDSLFELVTSACATPTADLIPTTFINPLQTESTLNSSTPAP